MDSKVLESLIIPEYEIANEGLGTELLKLAGAGALRVLKTIAIYLGITIGASGLIIGAALMNEKKRNTRYANPTSEELLSRNNFNNSWKPKIQEFLKLVNKDIDTVNKSNNIKKYMYIHSPNDNLSKVDGHYNVCICALEWSKVQDPGLDGDDEANPEKLKDFCNKLQELKPYISKWKIATKEFEPYFELVITINENEKDINKGWADFDIYLVCNWLDKDGILKPGLPELK